MLHAWARPLAYVYGKKIRSWAAGRMEPSIIKSIEDGEGIIGGGLVAVAE